MTQNGILMTSVSKPNFASVFTILKDTIIYCRKANFALPKSSVELMRHKNFVTKCCASHSDFLVILLPHLLAEEKMIPAAEEAKSTARFLEVTDVVLRASLAKLRGASSLEKSMQFFRILLRILSAADQHQSWRLHRALNLQNGLLSGIKQSIGLHHRSGAVFMPR